MYGVLLIVVLIITGGAIAFIGDRLGSKVGKKKLSIFGLRPRHTSIIVTIFTGVCIATLTFGVMAAASQNVRTALFGMEKLNQKMKTTQASLNQATEDLQAAQQQQQEANDALDQSRKDVETLKAQQQELEAESQRLQEGNRLLELAKAELMQRNDALVAQNDQLGQQNSSLSSANTALQGQNSLLTGKNEELTGKNASLTADNKDLETRNQDLRNGLLTIREGDIVFRAGEVIASGVIRGNRPAAEVDKDLQSLAQLASRNVSSRLGRNVSDKDVWIYKPEYNSAVQAIASSPQDMVVRIVAAGNLVRGEEVRASLELYKNSIIYKDREFILARPIALKGTGSGGAEQAVMSFLKEVNAAASAKGILPDPIRGSIGVMDGAQFYEVVNAINGMHGTVVLSAYAKGDTDALGPLRLIIKEEQMPDQP